MINEFKTADIKISTDSAGYMTASHKYQGILIEGGYYTQRDECRREAVIILKDIKEDS